MFLEGAMPQTTRQLELPFMFLGAAQGRERSAEARPARHEKPRFDPTFRNTVTAFVLVAARTTQLSRLKATSRAAAGMWWTWT